MDLASIAPAFKTVPLGRGTVEITGLSLRKLTVLVTQYPELLALAAGTVDLATLLVKVPETSLGVFSMAAVPSRWWQFWKRDAIKAFDSAGAGQQIEVLFDIFALSFEGDRARPFLKTVANSIAEQNRPAPESPKDPSTSADTSPPSPSV